MIWLNFLILLLGFVALLWSADKFVEGAAALAKYLGISPMVIGLTIVALGTSAPEIVVSVMAAYQGHPDLAIGNAIGSNIANVGLVIGISALIMPLTVQSETLRREFPILFVVMAITTYLMWDGILSRVEGMYLLLGLAVILGWFVYWGRHAETDPLVDEFKEILAIKLSKQKAFLYFLFGLITLPLISRFMVITHAVEIAAYFNVPETIIGLTLLAIGTSLPEVATSAIGAWRGEHDIAIGNVLGSNIFNLLAVLGAATVFGDIGVSADILRRDIPIMVALSVFMAVFAYGIRGPGKINRFEATLLLGMYGGYLTWLIYTAS